MVGPDRDPDPGIDEPATAEIEDDDFESPEPEGPEIESQPADEE